MNAFIAIARIFHNKRSHFAKSTTKMREYRDNGASLGWLINRKSRQVEIYRIEQEVEVLESPVSLSGEDILPGFVLNLEAIW